MASSALGPYSPAGSLVSSGAVWGAQTGAVWFTGADFVLFGDRWQSAPDHIKAHDFSYMAPLSFNSNGTVNVIATAFQDTVTIAY